MSCCSIANQYARCEAPHTLNELMHCAVFAVNYSPKDCARRLTTTRSPRLNFGDGVLAIETNSVFSEHHDFKSGSSLGKRRPEQSALL